MATPRSRRWMFAALAFAVASIVLWWLVVGRNPVVRLSDGREVSIVAITYGTNHVFVEGKPWAKLVRRLVSQTRAYQLGLRVYGHSTSTPSLMIWTHWRVPAATNRAPRHASVHDINNLETEPSSSVIEAPDARSRRAIMAWKLDNFPRNDPFTLRFYEREPSYEPVRVGEIQVRRQVSRTANRAAVSSVPLTRTNGALEFSLLSLRTGERPPPALTNRYNFIVRPTMAWFEVRENGALTTNWTIRGIQVVGTSGNRFQTVPPLVANEDGRIGIAFADVFWPNEEGWRIVVDFARSHDFPTNRLWTFQGLPAALSQPPFRTNLQEKAHGLLVEMLGIRAATWTFTRPFQRGAYRKNTEVSLVYTSAIPNLRMDLAQARDENGQSLRFGHGADEWRGRYLSGLELLTNTSRVDLTFALHQTEPVEFLVKPAFVFETTQTSTNKPGPRH